MTVTSRAGGSRRPARAGAAESDPLRRIARQMAHGDPVDWELAREESGGARGLEGLRMIDAIARVAKAERREMDELEASAPPVAAAAHPLPLADTVRDDGASWGPLLLREKIGQGSYGEVFRAHDPALQIDVALKLWFSQWTFDGGVDAFLTEARTLARVHHSNVLRVLGVARHDGRVGMWTELLAGDTLEAALATRGRFGASEAAVIGAELCRALAAVHALGIVHRDLKTTNVMRADGGRIVLMDFGSVTAATALAAGEGEAFPVGTPLAMAPEQLACQAVGPAADLYGLGVLLYRLVSGHYPIEASSFDELVERHARGERTPLRDRCPDVAAAFIEVVERALAHDPASRFASAGAFEQALLRCVQAEGAGAGGVDAGAGKHHNLQAPLTRFVGRDREVAECGELLARARLLTLTGVAGCGKTRLGIRLAEQALASHEGVWFVDLAPVNDPDRVVSIVAHILDVREERGRSLMSTIATYVGAKSLLLVLDNCEHLLGAAADVAVTLLRDCPNLRMIATTREALGVPGEAIFPIPSLSLPEAGAVDAERASRSEAVSLFAGCAALARPDFRLTDANAPVVSEICRRLDGIPLAIELAAARVKVLAPEEILARLDDRFRLLTGGSKWALPRHQTLLATLGWSYDLLTEAESELLRGLAVFAGGWTLEAAQRVCGAEDDIAVLDHLTRLVDKSLVVVERSARGASRHRLLETVRQFALDKLVAGGGSVAVRDRHLSWFASQVESFGTALRGGQGFGEALAWCDAEHENVLAALAWCEQSKNGHTEALRIVGSIFPYWTSRALFSLGLDHVTHALARPGAEGVTLERGKAAFAGSNLAFYRGDYAQSRAHGEASLAIFRQVDFKEGIVWSLNAVANTRMIEGDFETSRTFYEESLAVSRAIGYRRGMAIALNNLANLASETDDFAAALPLFQESVELNRAQGRTAALGLSLANLAETHVRLGQAESARDLLIECLEIFLETRRQDYGGHAIGVAGLMAEALGADATAARLLGAAEILLEAIGVPLQPAERKAQTDATARLRERLGAPALAAAWEEGRPLSFEASVASALAWLSGGNAIPRS